MNIDPNDPRLTAFVLGELDATERADVEALIIESADCRQAVDEIRLVAGWLSTQLHEESSAHSAAPEVNHRPVALSLLEPDVAPSPPPHRPWWRLSPGRIKLVAAGILVAAGLAVLPFVRFAAKPRAELSSVTDQMKAEIAGGHKRLFSRSTLRGAYRSISALRAAASRLRQARRLHRALLYPGRGHTRLTHAASLGEAEQQVMLAEEPPSRGGRIAAGTDSWFPQAGPTAVPPATA